MNDIPVTDVNDPRLDIFRSMKRTNASRQSGLFVVEGTTLVERLFQSNYAVECVLASEQKIRNFSARVPDAVTVYTMPRSMAAGLVGYSFHTGVMAAAYRRDSPELRQVLGSDKAGLVLVADQVIDQQNLGLIIRIASAFGASAVLVGFGCADPFSRRVLRVSMGNGMFLPIVESDDTVASVGQLQVLGYSCFSAVLDESAEELSKVQFPERTAIVVGNETHGVSEEVQQIAHRRLTISMLNGTDSLNVGIATGIAVHGYRVQHPFS